jgi:hypothetical protein
MGSAAFSPRVWLTWCFDFKVCMVASSPLVFAMDCDGAPCAITVVRGSPSEAPWPLALLLDYEGALCAFTVVSTCRRCPHRCFSLAGISLSYLLRGSPFEAPWPFAVQFSRFNFIVFKAAMHPLGSEHKKEEFV